jgi:uncharacterized protein YegP (UPF0339 family)
MNFVIYADNGGRFQWRLDDGDGKVVATSGPSYPSATAARKAAVRVHDQAGAAGGAET